MIIRSTTEEIDKYFDDEAISQSKLKALIPGVDHFNKLNEEDEKDSYYEEKGHLIIGKGVDSYLSVGEEGFLSLFHPSDIESKPTKGILSVVKYVFDNRKGDDIRQEGKLIAEAYENDNFQARWTESTRLEKFLEQKEYWNKLLEAEGKQILTEHEFNLIKVIANNFTGNQVTYQYFDDVLNQEKYFQLFIKFQYKNVNCKSLLDLVIVDIFNKTIQPVDIKTIGDYVINFIDSLRRFRYDFQAGFYTEALKSWRNKCYPGFKILPFQFLVESTKKPGNPRVFTCTERLLKIGKFGRPSITYRLGEGLFTIKQIKGFDSCMDDYLWYQKNGFDTDRIVVENKNFDIDWNGLKIN